MSFLVSLRFPFELYCLTFIWSFAVVFQVIDTFEVFDANIWSSQCSGCVYNGNGSLLVTGDDMLQRTVGTFKALTFIKANLVKNYHRDDHGIIVSILSE